MARPCMQIANTGPLRKVAAEGMTLADADGTHLTDGMTDAVIVL